MGARGWLTWGWQTPPGDTVYKLGILSSGATDSCLPSRARAGQVLGTLSGALAIY